MALVSVNTNSGQNELVSAINAGQVAVQQVLLFVYIICNKILNVFFQQGPARTSSLMAPIMLLSGHPGDIFNLKFHPDGQCLVSSGFDRQICKFFHPTLYLWFVNNLFLSTVLWNVYGECENFAVLSGHTGAIMDMQLSTDGDTIYTASTDKTICLWDMKSGNRIKKLKGIVQSHQNY